MTKLIVFISFFISLSAHAQRPIRGLYQVPVSENLKPFANYPVKFKSDTYENTPNKITFPLPAELVGDSTMVEISKTPDGTWMGPNAQGSCQYGERYIKCNLKFNDLTIDSVRVETAVRQRFPAEQVQGRLSVAEKFSGEPIGIIIYRLR